MAETSTRSLLQLWAIAASVLTLASFFPSMIVVAFSPTVLLSKTGSISQLHAETSTTTTATSRRAALESSVAALKKVLQREYTSFFNPMEREYYEEDVIFYDPLATLSGIDAYQNNVDMLAGRTLLGSLLFEDATINLHTISGGTVDDNFGISEIETRWTLGFCFKILPWKPTARFSGISVYKVQASGESGSVQIVQQDDYWDSINLQPGGSYRAVSKSTGLGDFLNQLKPKPASTAAAPELPYELLRRADGYEVRRYPNFTAAQLVYERRDEGYLALGAFTQGMNPLAPAILRVTPSQKSMLWPLTYCVPGQTIPPLPPLEDNDLVQVVTEPGAVVAVGSFSQASVEPVIRQTTLDLRAMCRRDGLELSTDDDLQFCQYDAVYSIGQRRGEVWILLREGAHPWSETGTN